MHVNWMTLSVLPALALLGQLAASEEPAEPQATVRLLNPTAWQGPTAVEVPVGRIAAPNVIDWSRTQLISNGRILPFAIREGRAHWKAELRSPGTRPRSEDLLVFTCDVPPGKWVQVDVISGTSEAVPAVQRGDGRLTIDYPAGRTVFDEGTGSLLSWEACGTSLLSAPFTVAPCRLAEDGYQLSKGPLDAGTPRRRLACGRSARWHSRPAASLCRPVPH